MTQITYPNDETGSIQIAHGSDGRLNVSSRTDARSYYSSRDNGKLFSWYSTDATAVAGEFPFYLQNTDTNDALVIKVILVSSVEAALWKAVKATGTATGGSAITGTNLNFESSNDATSNALGNGAVAGFTPGAILGAARTVALGTYQANLDDSIRLGQNDAFAIEYDTGTTGVADITVIGYYE